MRAEFKAKLKGIAAKEGGTVIQLEPETGSAAQIADMMPRVGLYFHVTVEDGQMEIEGLEAE